MAYAVVLGFVLTICFSVQPLNCLLYHSQLQISLLFPPTIQQQRVVVDGGQDGDVSSDGSRGDGAGYGVEVPRVGHKNKLMWFVYCCEDTACGLVYSVHRKHSLCMQELVKH